MRVAASWVRTGARFAGVGLCAVLSCAAAMAQMGKPEKLECESLVTPLGMDAEKPTLSWQLRDTRDGAKQTAYEVQVASSATNLAAGKGDIWDSGKVESSDSIGVVYAGPAMQASKRYFWRVLVWDRDGKAYPASDATWWETGLLKQENWKAKWIGFQEAEERAVRESGAQWVTNAETESAEKKQSSHAFRFQFYGEWCGEARGFVCDGAGLDGGVGEWEAGDGDAANGGVWAFAVEDILFARCDE